MKTIINMDLKTIINMEDKIKAMEDKLNNNDDEINFLKGSSIKEGDLLKSINDKINNLEEKIKLANKKIHKHINDDDDDNDIITRCEISANKIILGNEKSRYINVNKCAVDIAKYRTYEDGGDINAEDIKAIEDIIFKHINLTNKGGK